MHDTNKNWQFWESFDKLLTHMEYVVSFVVLWCCGVLAFHRYANQQLSNWSIPCGKLGIQTVPVWLQFMLNGSQGSSANLRFEFFGLEQWELGQHCRTAMGYVSGDLFNGQNVWRQYAYHDWFYPGIVAQVSRKCCWCNSIYLPVPLPPAFSHSTCQSKGGWPFCSIRILTQWFEHVIWLKL